MERNPRRHRMSQRNRSTQNKSSKIKMSKESSKPRKENNNYSGNNDTNKLNFTKVLMFVLLPILLALCIIGFKNLKTALTSYKIVRKNPIRYYTTFVDNNWGVIDSNGNEVIPNEYKEMIIIPNNEKDVFIVTYDISSKDKFSTRAVNKNNNSVIKKRDIVPIQYDLNEISYDKNILAFKQENKYGFIDYEGNVKAEAKYDSFKVFPGIKNRILIEENGKKGVLNTTNFNVVVAPVYKEVIPVNSNENTAYIVVFDNLKGVTSCKNQTILSAEFNEIYLTNSNKYFVAKKGNDKSIYNEKGEAVSKDIKNDPVDIMDNIVISKNDKNKFGATDFEKNIIIPFEYDDIKFAGLNTYIVKKDGKYNISQYFTAKKDIVKQEKDRKNILKKPYDSIEYISEGNFYLAHENKNDNNLDVYDNKFDLKISGIIEDINYAKSFIKVKNGKTYKYYMFNFQEKSEKDVYPENNLYMFEENGKIGFVNDKNNVIVPAIYDEAMVQNPYGFIPVSRNNKWGVLDHMGNVIIEPSLDLSQNTKIDFIKNYYLDKNVELNTYKKGN